MNLPLGPDAQRAIEKRIERGDYSSAEEVVMAGLAALDREEGFGDFSSGELDTLLEEGEKSGDPLDGEQVLAELRALRSRQPGNAG